jgi:glycerol kinase
MADYLLALDQGSTHSKAALFNRRGRVVRLASVPLRTFRPKPLWAEHRPEEILRSQFQAAERVLRAAGGKRNVVRAIGLAAQRSTLLIWDKATGKPVLPAMSWQDLRAAEELPQLSGYRDLIRTKTGLVLSPYYAAMKLRWVLERVRGIRARAEAGRLLCGTVNTFLLWHLTRGEIHATDPTHAARMLLMNLHTLQWDSELLELFGIPPSLLPKILPSVSDFGTAKLFGRQLPIRACIGDQQAAMLGLGAVRMGEAVINYGTGGFLLVNVGSEPVLLPGLLSNLAWTTEQETVYVAEGTVNSVGTMFEWLAQMGLIRSIEEVDRIMRTADRGSRSGICLVPALAGLGAPHWLEEAGIGILGVGPTTSRTDLVRAAVEGIAFLLRDIHEVICKDGRIRIRQFTASGGGSRLQSLIQTQADFLGLPILQSSVAEATVMGAALLAGVGCGWWKSPSAVPRVMKGKLFRPRLSESERERCYQTWKRALEAIEVFSRK